MNDPVDEAIRSKLAELAPSGLVVCCRSVSLMRGNSWERSSRHSVLTAPVARLSVQRSSVGAVSPGPGGESDRART